MKKRIFYILALLMALVLCAVVLVACGDETEETQGEPSGSENAGSESSSEAATLDNTKFNMFFNKEYLCKLVWPQNATDGEKSVAKEFRTALSKQTGKQINFVAENKVTAEDQYLVLLGNTSYQESKDVYASLGEREAVAKIVGNKLVIAFSNESSGIGIVKILVEELAKSADGEVRLKLDYNEKYKALPELDALPAYDEMTGDIIYCGEDTLMMHASSSSVFSFKEYCASIEAAEFKKISTREEKGNIFNTYVGENDYIYAYYSEYNHSARIITGPIEQLAYEDYSIDTTTSVTPYIATIGQPNRGMGYALRLSDGRFVIIDGGYSGGDRVYKTLKELQPEGNIVIAAWFLSHPHGDHQPAFIDFIKAHSNDKDVVLERVIHSYVDSEMYNINGNAGNDTSGTAVLELYSTMATYAKDVPVIKAHTGQQIAFGEDVIEVLYTPEDHLPSGFVNINDTSMVIRLFTHDQSAIFLADTCYKSEPILDAMWGSYLKSDICQIAHHGMYPTNEAIYNFIQAKTVFLPAMYSDLKVDLWNSTWVAVTNKYLSYASDVYVSDDDIVIVELPHTPVNNKDAMIAKIKAS